MRHPDESLGLTGDYLPEEADGRLTVAPRRFRRERRALRSARWLTVESIQRGDSDFGVWDVGLLMELKWGQ